jgi:hypothetical protein
LQADLVGTWLGQRKVDPKKVELLPALKQDGTGGWEFFLIRSNEEIKLTQKHEL